MLRNKENTFGYNSPMCCF